MTHPILTRLAPFRTRCRLRAALAGVIVGLLAAAVLAVVLGWAGARPGVVPAALLGVPLAGALVGWFWPQRWPAVAAAVDEAAGLDDRLVAAVEYASLPDPPPMHELQLRDAASRLDAVPARSAVPVRPPRGWPVAVIAYLAAAGLWLAGVGTPPAAAAVPENVLAAAKMLDDIAAELELDAAAENSDDLRELAKKLRATAEELRQNGCDCASAMAKVSQLQDEVARRLGGTDAKAEGGLKKIGGAMQGAGPLREAGKALEQGRYARAARMLAGVPGAKFDPKEARTAADDLNKAADSLDAEQLPTLSQPARQLAKGAAGDREQLRLGAETLARQAQEQERRKRMNLLTARLHKLLVRCKEQLQSRNLLDQTGKPGEDGKPAGADAKAGDVPGQEELRKKLEDPKFRAHVEALLKKFDPDGTGEIEEGPADGEPADPTGKRSPAGRDRLRKLEQRLEEALQREKVPVIYHEAVRNYFRRLARQEAP